MALGSPRPSTTGKAGSTAASIVFDYNSPVRTNTATPTVLLASAAVARHAAAAWDAYPNPATDAVTVAADLATGGPVRLEIIDALGRPVRQQVFTAPAGALRQTLDLRGLAAGLYVLRLTPPTGPASSQRLVREQPLFSFCSCCQSRAVCKGGPAFWFSLRLGLLGCGPARRHLGAPGRSASPGGGGKPGTAAGLARF